MRPRSSYLQYAQDMLAWAIQAESHLGDTSYEEFITNRMMMHSVVKCLEVMGEAANKIPTAYRKRYPEIRWRALIATRNELVHEYANTKYSRVYEIVRYQLRPLYPHLQKLIREIEEDEA